MANQILIKPIFYKVPQEAKYQFDTYAFVKRTIAITAAETDDGAKQADKISKEVIFKNCAPFTNSISEINITQGDNKKDLDIVMPMYHLIGYSVNYSKS